MKNRIIIAVLLLAFLVSATSCVRVDDKGKIDTTDVVDNDKKDKETKDESYDYFKTDEETFVINTPYCPLKYPIKWKEYVRTDEVQVQDTYGVAFSAVIGEQNYTLYTIAFGSALEGFKLGTVKTEKGTVDVYFVDSYDTAVESLPEDQSDIYYQMSDDMNVIISKLVYDNGMELAD